MEPQDLQEPVETPQVEDGAESAICLCYQKVSRVEPPGLQQGVYWLDGTLVQEDGQLLAEGLGFCRVAYDGHLDPATGWGPASELKYVPVGQGGKDPRVPGGNSPIAELLLGKPSDDQPLSLSAGSPGLWRLGGYDGQHVTPEVAQRPVALGPERPVPAAEQAVDMGAEICENGAGGQLRDP